MTDFGINGSDKQNKFWDFWFQKNLTSCFCCWILFLCYLLKSFYSKSLPDSTNSRKTSSATHHYLISGWFRHVVYFLQSCREVHETDDANSIPWFPEHIKDLDRYANQVWIFFTQFVPPLNHIFICTFRSCRTGASWTPTTPGSRTPSTGRAGRSLPTSPSTTSSELK